MSEFSYYGESFFQSRFSFTGTSDSQDRRGREETTVYSTLPLLPGHENSDMTTWDDYHVFLIVQFVFTRLLLYEVTTLSNYHLTD